MFLIEDEQRMVIPRTELTYPCHELKFHEKAAQADVDHVMADFEDACPYEFKGPLSRATMVDALNKVDFGDKVVTVRPNNVRSKFFRGDLEAALAGAPDKFHGVILPKVGEPEDVIYLDRLLSALEQEHNWKTRLAIETLIETPLAVENAYRIAKASDRMVGLIFGIADFASALGVREIIDNQNTNFHYAKQRIVVAAKAAGLHAIDNAWMRLVRRDTPPEQAEQIEQQMREKVEGAAALGMDGTWVIHPLQAQISNAAFTPTDTQLEEAEYSVNFYHKQGGGAMFDPKYGKFHDEATIKGALMELAKGAQAGKIKQEYLHEMAAKSAEVTGYNILEMMKRVQ
jgi:citrate lyase beta subunit